MTITKAEAEQLFELTEPYTKTDLKKAARKAIKKWHPDMAARNGIDPAVATEQYGKIADAEKHLTGYFDGKPDDYKETPSAGGTGSSTSTQTTSSAANSTNNAGTTRTRRATTRNTTSTTSDQQASQTSTSSTTTSTRATTAQSAQDEYEGGRTSTTDKTKETQYWDAAEGRWKTDPTGQREGWYEGGEPEEEQEPTRRRTQSPPRRPREPREPRQRARTTHTANMDEETNPRPRRQSFTQQEPPQQEIPDDSDNGPSTIPEYLHHYARMVKKVRKWAIVFFIVATLLSVEAAVRRLDLSAQPLWFSMLLFVTPLSFLLATFVEYAFHLFSYGACRSLEGFATALDNNNPVATVALVILRLVFTIFRALYKVVGWGLSRILGT